MKILATVFSAVLLALAASAQEKTPLVFEAKDAKLKAAGGIKFETRPDQQNYGAWNNTNAAVSWTCTELPKGTYRVIAVYSCNSENPGGEFEVTVGNQRASFTVTATRGWTDFKEADLGPVIIRKPGPVEITARVTRIARQWGINLRAVKLVPEP